MRDVTVPPVPTRQDPTVTNAPRPTKNQRREEAREAARAAREKAEKRKKLLRWLIPTVSSIAILAIVGGVVWAVVAFQPPPKQEAGPANMISDGILFEADGDGGLQYVPTGAIEEGHDPIATTPHDEVLNIVTYVDFACPACRVFEATNSDYIQKLVAEGEATLEVHPIAILDPYFRGREVSTRANNVGACVANHAPESFIDVMAAMFANQEPEGTVGMNNRALIDVVHGAGLENAEVDACIDGGVFTPWVTATTQRALQGPLPNSDIPQVGGTPTVLVNGAHYEGPLADPTAFTQFVEQQRGTLSGQNSQTAD